MLKLLVTSSVVILNCYIIERGFILYHETEQNTYFSVLVSLSRHLSHLCREATEEGEPEVDEGEGEVLVEEVAQELAHAHVGPSAVHQQEALQEAELGEGVVAGQDRLHALLTRDAHAYMRRWGRQNTEI